MKNQLKNEVRTLVCEEPILTIMAKIKEYDDMLYKHTINTANLVSDMLDTTIFADEFTKAERKNIITAALVHDIGMTNIPKNIYLKENMLNSNEYSIVKSHVLLSYNILKEMTFADEICEIARIHHREFSNKRYAKELHSLVQKTELIMIADVFCALTEDRPYRDKIDIDKALLQVKFQYFDSNLITYRSYYALTEVFSLQNLYVHIM